DRRARRRHRIRAAGHGRPVTMLASLRYERFRWLLAGNLFASAARWAVTLVLAIQVLDLTRSSFWVGLALFLTQGSQVLVAPVAGGTAWAWAFITVLHLVSAIVSTQIGEVRGGAARGEVKFGIGDTYRYLRASGAAWIALWAVTLHCTFTMSYQGMLPGFVEG